MIVTPKEEGAGMKTDIASPTYAWRNLLGRIHPRTATLAPNAATLEVYRGGEVRDWCFAAGDRSDNVFQLPHDYKKGTDIYLSVSWSHNGTAISGNAVINFYTTYAKGYNQEIFPAEKNTIITYNTVDIATTPRYSHRANEVILSSAGGSATLLDNALFEPDGILLINTDFTTIPAITGGSPNRPFLHMINLHYQTTGVGTKTRDYPFYT